MVGTPHSPQEASSTVPAPGRSPKGGAPNDPSLSRIGAEPAGTAATAPEWRPTRRTSPTYVFVDSLPTRVPAQAPPASRVIAGACVGVRRPCATPLRVLRRGTQSCPL